MWGIAFKYAIIPLISLPVDDKQKESFEKNWPKTTDATTKPSPDPPVSNYHCRFVFWQPQYLKASIIFQITLQRGHLDFF